MTTDPEQPERDEGFPCHWTHSHGRHTWFPLVADPEIPRLLFLDIKTGGVVCPGR